ncbi:SDR family NAD(P)-dependent oxidoreductase [Jatrophihabitans sp. YIM 134969]
MRSLEGMSVLVTGGGSGLGEAVARHFVARGARVTISGRRAAKIDAVAHSLGDACRAVTGDVAVPADRARMVDAAVEHGGGLETLVNAAGNMYRTAIADLDEEQFLDLFHTNVVGPSRLTADALPHLTAARGNVVFFGSVHTQRAFPGASPYAATKGALETLTGVLAAELGPAGVRVNAIRPGGVPTEINQRAGLGTDEESLARLNSLASAHALGRIGTPEEIAEGVAYLAAAEWVTGIVLGVDGGMSLGVTNA